MKNRNINIMSYSRKKKNKKNIILKELDVEIDSNWSPYNEDSFADNDDWLYDYDGEDFLDDENF